MELVNGYRCYNCTDVDYAKRNIDPAHPKDGPYGLNASGKAEGASWGPAVQLGGALSGVGPTSSPPGGPAPEPGSRLDLKV
jgi:hypothetical protein